MADAVCFALRTTQAGKCQHADTLGVIHLHPAAVTTLRPGLQVDGASRETRPWPKPVIELDKCGFLIVPLPTQDSTG